MGGGENRGGGTGPIRANGGPAEDRHLLEASAAACLPGGRPGGEGSLPQTFFEKNWDEHWQSHESLEKGPECAEEAKIAYMIQAYL